MNESVQNFYDSLTQQYHLMFADWRSEVKHQGILLNQFIRKHQLQPVRTLLDCTCGIGTQSIGLALEGYEVCGSDLSEEAIVRAKNEADSFGVTVNFKTADLFKLNQFWQGNFDCVVSFDNALSHFINNSDLKKATDKIYDQLKPNGLFIGSIRDYNLIIEQSRKTSPTVMQQLPGEYEHNELPRSTLPRIFANPQRVAFQVWDWSEDKTSYKINQFFVVKNGEGWLTSHYVTTFRALLRHDLQSVLEQSGFKNVQWHMPEESGFYQPMVTAIRG